MQPPKISNRFRRKAGRKAVEARQERAEVKDQVTNGKLYFFDLFSDTRKSISRMKLVDLLQSVPGIGKVRAELILERTKISPSRRIGGVGHRQLELLRQEFLLMKNSPKTGKLLVVSGPSGVGKSTITNHLRSDNRFWISVSVTTRPIRIVGAFVRISNVDTPLALITEQYYTNIANKAQAGTPQKLLYRPDTPYGRILLYPTPNAVVPLFIKAEKMIGQYATLVTTQYLPPGYQRLLELSLAMELAPEYGSQVKPEIIANLRADLDSLIRTNIQPLPVNKTDNLPNTNTTFNMPPI